MDHQNQNKSSFLKNNKLIEKNNAFSIMSVACKNSNIKIIEEGFRLYDFEYYDVLTLFKEAADKKSCVEIIDLLLSKLPDNKSVEIVPIVTDSFFYLSNHASCIPQMKSILSFLPNTDQKYRVVFSSILISYFSSENNEHDKNTDKLIDFLLSKIPTNKLVYLARESKIYSLKNKKEYISHEIINRKIKIDKEVYEKNITSNNNARKKHKI